MEQQIRQKIEQAIIADKFLVSLVNSYSLNRRAVGGWKLIIFYGIKGKKGQKRDTQLPIGTDKTFRRIVEDVLENIIEENINHTLLGDNEEKPTENTDAKKGW